MRSLLANGWDGDVLNAGDPEDVESLAWFKDSRW